VSGFWASGNFDSHPFDYYILLFRTMAGFQIPIETKINFLEYILIPSFVVPLDSSQTREDWMRNTAGKVYGDNLEILISSTKYITSLERAEAKIGEERAERERLAERAERERLAERAERERLAERAERERLAERAERLTEIAFLLQLEGTLILFSLCSYFLFFSLFQLSQFNNNPIQSLQKS
jgi:hypothetical protein